MFKVIFKGDMEDIVISNEQGEQLMARLDNGKGGMIELGKMMFDAGSVKGIIPTSEEFRDRGLRATPEEMEELAKKVQPFSQRKINGRLISKFDQYLCSIKAQYIDETGDIVIRDAVEVTNQSRINSAWEASEYFKWWNEVKDRPEELAAHYEMIKKYRPANFGKRERKEGLQAISELL